MLKRLTDETESFRKHQREGAGAGGERFPGTADDENDGFARSRRSVFRTTKKTVDVLARGSGKTAEEEQFAQEGKEEPTAQRQQMGGETGEEIGETGSVGHEGAKGADGNDAVRMITEDVRSRRI